jgi:hypothetical protein
LAAESGGTDIPPALREKPTLHSFETEVWNAFCRLSLRRPVSGFGAVGAIPYVEITAYLDHFCEFEDPEDHQLFIQLLEQLDASFLKDVSERQQAERKKNEKPSAAKRRRTV